MIPACYDPGIFKLSGWGSRECLSLSSFPSGQWGEDAPLPHAPECGLPGAPLFTQIFSARPPGCPAERGAGPSPWVFSVGEGLGSDTCSGALSSTPASGDTRIEEIDFPFSQWWLKGQNHHALWNPVTGSDCSWPQFPQCGQTTEPQSWSGSPKLCSPRLPCPGGCVSLCSGKQLPPRPAGTLASCLPPTSSMPATEQGGTYQRWKRKQSISTASALHPG